MDRARFRARGPEVHVSGEDLRELSRGYRPTEVLDEAHETSLREAPHGLAQAWVEHGV